jgi:GxxExxY protein
MAPDPLTERHEEVARAIVASAFAVHKALGPGLLENIYEVCLAHEISKRGLEVARQTAIPIVYDNITFEEGLRLDLLVDDLVICEVKAVETMLPVFMAQTLSQLKLTGRRLAFLINFNTPLIKDGIRRIVL